VKRFFTFCGTLAETLHRFKTAFYMPAMLMFRVEMIDVLDYRH
jgi:hypothetical protein